MAVWRTPVHAGEPTEVAVERDDGAPVRDAQGGEVGVGRQVGARAVLAQQPAHNPSMVSGGFDNHGGGGGKPGIHDVHGLVGGERPWEHLGFGRQPHEREEHHPSQSHRAPARQRPVELATGPVVMVGVGIDRVEQVVDVD